MKLANHFMTLLLCSMLIGLTGCNRSTSLEKFTQLLKQRQGMVVTYTTPNNKSVRSILAKKDSGEKSQFVRASVEVKPFYLKVNETQGSLEWNTDSQEYYELPETRQFFAGTGKVFPSYFTNAGPLFGTSPTQFAPLKSWSKYQGTGGNDRWKTTVDTAKGPVTVVIDLTADGTPVQFEFGSDVFKVQSFAWDDSLDPNQFQWQIPDGFLPFSKPLEKLGLLPGAKWSNSSLTGSGKFKGWKPQGATIYALVDPGDQVSQKLLQWISSIKDPLPIVPVSSVPMPDGLIDQSGKFVDEMVKATPTLVLVGKDGKVEVMWQGFDSGTSDKLLKEIREKLLEAT